MLCFAHASLIAGTICVIVFLMEPMIVGCTLITGPELEMLSTSALVNRKFASHWYLKLRDANFNHHHLKRVLVSILFNKLINVIEGPS